MKSRQFIWVGVLIAAALASYLGLALRPLYIRPTLWFSEDVPEAARAVAVDWYRSPEAVRLWTRPGIAEIPDMLSHPLTPYSNLQRPLIRGDEKSLAVFGQGFVAEFSEQDGWRVIGIHRP